MIKQIMHIMLLLSINIISNAQDIRVEIKDSLNESEQPELFIINEKDTIKLNFVNQFVFKVDSTSFGNTWIFR